MKAPSPPPPAAPTFVPVHMPIPMMSPNPYSTNIYGQPQMMPQYQNDMILKSPGNRGDIPSVSQ